MRHRTVKAQRIHTIAYVIVMWGVFLCLGGGESLQASDPQRIAETSTASGPSEQSATSVQALVIGSDGVLYAGSFGHGMFRTVDRGATWAPVGGGIT
ncbi:MAG: hypothetical protein AABZ24_04175, partial [Nitrospirota bacterium]